MNSRLNYEEIRELLLKDDNINEVSVDQKKRTIILRPIDAEYIFVMGLSSDLKYKTKIMFIDKNTNDMEVL